MYLKEFGSSLQPWKRRYRHHKTTGVCYHGGLASKCLLFTWHSEKQWDEILNSGLSRVSTSIRYLAYGISRVIINRFVGLCLVECQDVNYTIFTGTSCTACCGWPYVCRSRFCMVTRLILNIYQSCCHSFSYLYKNHVHATSFFGVEDVTCVISKRRYTLQGNIWRKHYRHKNHSLATKWEFVE